MGIVYRFRQFWKAWKSAPSAEDIILVQETLSPELTALFLQMQPSDQAHSLKIFKQFQLTGQNSPDLLAAALLHDVGKSCYRLTPWERGLAVILHLLAPKLADQWGKSDLPGWKKPFIVYRCHPEWGANLVEAAGGSPLLVDLVRRHQQPLSRERLERTDFLDSSLALADGFLVQLQSLDDES